MWYVGHVLERIRYRPLGHPPYFLELAGIHQAAGKREIAKNDFGDERDHAKGRQILWVLRDAEVVLGGADEPRGDPAERMRERRPLRDCGQWHSRQWYADHEAGGNRDDDPEMVNDGRLGPRDDYRQGGCGDR